MSARNRAKRTGRGKGLSFVQFQHRMLEHPRFNALSGAALKTLMFLASQFRGQNNGDLTIAWKVAKKAGFTSNGNLRRGTQELVDAGFVIQSRQGGRNRCSLYALSWFAIDHCDGKLDIPATNVAPNDWLRIEPPVVQLSEPRAVQCAPRAVQSGRILLEKGVH